MTCFLQTPTGDLDLSRGNLVIVTDFNTQLAQKLTNRFQLFLGEWFADTRIGVPYFQLVYVKNPNLLIIRQLFRRVIMQTPGVKDILAESIEFDNTDRSLTAGYKIQSITGAILQGGLGQPFIVTLGSQIQQ